MRKRYTFLKNISLLICLCLFVCSCNNVAHTDKATKPTIKYNKPANIMSESDYIKRVEEFCAYKTFSTADDAYLKKVDALGDDLRDMIIYNEDEIEIKGTKYYVSNDGNDKNDGLTPKTAWATLEKVNSVNYEKGDAVLFNRGDFFEGRIIAKSGVTYSAYGKGFKPQISYSFNGLTYGEWVKTDKENIWKLDFPVINDDIGLLVFNMGEAYGEKKMSRAALKTNLDFTHSNSNAAKGKELDNRIYLYYDKGNPAELFYSIEMSRGGHVVYMGNGTNNVTLHNLEIRCGDVGFFPNYSSNIKVSYCTFAWTGGLYKENCRLGGGAGCWHSCDNMIFEHCYFYQQFDSGVTPQYDWNDADPCIYKNFRTTACLFEYCEYPFEYFLTQHTSRDEKYIDTYFGYNFVRKTGYGFGDKPTQSACVKSWSAPNPQENFLIEKNIFDRPYVRLLDMGAKTQDGEFDFKLLPKMNNNVYITVKNRGAIRLNEQRFRFNEKGYAELEKIGFETNAVYMFCDKY